MKSYATAALALEADANTVALLVAWERREAGDAGPWQAFASWEMTADITARFASAMSETGDAAQAAAAAFDQWFALDERRERYYVAHCSQYLDIQDETNLLPSYRQLAEDYLDRVCVLPDGSPYPCDGNSGRSK